MIYFCQAVAGEAARRLVTVCVLSAFCLLPSAFCFAQYAQPPRRGESSAQPPEALKNIGIEQRQGNSLPLDARFRDEAGNEVRLGDYFGRQRPVVIAPVYYDCPMLCNQVLHGLVAGLRGQSLELGRDFDVVAVSFDQREGPQSAFNKEQVMLSELRRKDDPVAASGLHFLTGERAQIDAVMDAVGFRYAFDERTNQFAHAAGVMVATPEGKLSHYFYGIEYAPRDLKLALVESSGGKIGSAVDKLVLYCYHYDPTTGKYGPAIMNMMRVAGVVTVVGLVALILILRRTKARRATDATAGARPARAGGAA
ncbi:MAG TPA: SCO family protein [Pyrinomonadaceae bacterium]|nr:SCO family protein [Pyrinomonadaceae bacterium]